MLERFGLADPFVAVALDIGDQLIDPLENLAVLGLPPERSPPRRTRPRRVSPQQVPLDAAAVLEAVDGGQQPPGVLRAAEQVRGFLE